MERDGLQSSIPFFNFFKVRLSGIANNHQRKYVLELLCSTLAECSHQCAYYDGGKKSLADAGNHEQKLTNINLLSVHNLKCHLAESSYHTVPNLNLLADVCSGKDANFTGTVSLEYCDAETCIEVGIEIVGIIDWLISHEWQDIFNNGNSADWDILFDGGTKSILSKSLVTFQKILTEKKLENNTATKQLQELIKIFRIVPQKIAEENEKPLQTEKPVSAEVKSLATLSMELDKRLENYQDTLFKVVTNPVYHSDPRWIACLQQNLDLVSDKRLIQQLLELALSDDFEPKPALLDLCMECLRGSSLPVFTFLQEWLWSSNKGYQLFINQLCSTFDQRLNEAFNKVTSIGVAEMKMLSVSVGCLALQNPVETLKRAVIQAVSSPEALTTVCQVLQCLPSITSHTAPGATTSLLCSEVIKLLMIQTWESGEEVNLMDLIIKLCQPFMLPSDPDCPLWFPSILDPLEVLTVAILPRISVSISPTFDRRPPSDNHTKQPKLCSEIEKISLLRTLKVLHLLLRTHSYQSTIDVCNELGPDVLFPLTLILLELWEESLLCDGGLAVLANWEKVNKFELKDLVLQCLDAACDNLSKFPSESLGYQWLWRNVSSLHFTIKLLISERVKGMSNEFFQYVDECVLNLIQIWQETYYSDTSKQNSTQSAVMIMLLQICSISNSLAEKVIQAIVKLSQEHSEVGLSHNALAVAMATVLPSCVRTECDIIVSSVMQMLREEGISVPYTSRSTTIPLINLDVSRSVLSLSQLFLASFHVCKSLTPQLDGIMWQNLIKLYTLTFQDQLKSFTDETVSNGVAIFTMSQIFHHTTIALQLIPASRSEPIFVLALEILGHLEELLSVKTRCHDARLIYEDLVASSQKIPRQTDRNTIIRKLNHFSIS